MTPSNWEPRPGPEGSHDPKAWKKLVDDMYDWGKELELWGKRVRRDILALEAQRDLLAEKLAVPLQELKREFRRLAEEAHEKVKLPGPYEGGDPEDPPPPPWKK